MKLNQPLNYQLITPQASQQGKSQSAQSTIPIILIHGLFGDLNNLGVLGRDLSQYHPVLQIDVRNHGSSPRADNMDYADCAQDVLSLAESLNIEKMIIIGHSMGGKIAMAMTAIAPEKIESIVVIDMAPVAYQVHRHDKIFAALERVADAQVETRQQAATIMSETLPEAGVIQFLLKSFKQGEWKFNLPVLKKEYSKIIGWQDVPTWNKPALFIPGGNSDYVTNAYRPAIMKQFPQAKAWVVAGTGHWVHAEKPDAVLRAIHRFLAIAE